jgi:hypothetical protein
VASTVVPEPSTLALLAAGGLILSVVAGAVFVDGDEGSYPLKTRCD